MKSTEVMQRADTASFLSNINEELRDPSSKTKTINMILFVVVSLHIGLLCCLEILDDKEQILHIVTFIHYYPMSIAIILCFLWIYWKLRCYINFECLNASKRHAAQLQSMKRKTLILFCLICQRDLVEIVSFSVFPFQGAKIPNPLTANTLFTCLNIPSIMLYMIAYIISIKAIINGPHKPKKVR